MAYTLKSRDRKSLEQFHITKADIARIEAGSPVDAVVSALADDIDILCAAKLSSAQVADLILKCPTVVEAKTLLLYADSAVTALSAEPKKIFAEELTRIMGTPQIDVSHNGKAVPVAKIKKLRWDALSEQLQTVLDVDTLKLIKQNATKLDVVAAVAEHILLYKDAGLSASQIADIAIHSPKLAYENHLASLAQDAGEGDDEAKKALQAAVHNLEQKDISENDPRYLQVSRSSRFQGVLNTPKKER